VAIPDQKSLERLCAIWNSAQSPVPTRLGLELTYRADVRRLRLQVERALLAQAQLRALLIAADTSVADYRRDLRNLKARMARRSPVQERST